MKIAVFAGTYVDTKMGSELLIKNGFEVVECPMSKTPMEQTKMQYYSEVELTNLFKKKLQEAMENGVEKAFIYCNSLSSAFNYKKVSQELNIEIITPLEIYETLPKNVKSVAIFAANGMSSQMIDKIVVKNGIKSISIGNMSIVEEIETKKSPKEIIEKLAIDKLIEYLEKISGEYKVDSIILGCTHFPYLKEEIEKLTKINIIDPAEEMIKKLRA